MLRELVRLSATKSESMPGRIRTSDLRIRFEERCLLDTTCCSDNDLPQPGFKQKASGSNTIEYKIGEIFGEIKKQDLQRL